MRPDPAAARGWAVACATDIAFSLAIVRLLGERCPLSLRVLLTAIAVVDDLGAIVLIALFYGTSIQVEMLAAAAVCFAVLVALNRLGLKTLPLYLIAGALLWYCVFRSGIHPTIAGVLTAATIPMRGEQGGRDQSAGHWLETFLQPWVVFIILPLFALLNAGVSIAGLQGQDLVAPVTLGVALGLVAGKTVGICGWLPARRSRGLGACAGALHGVAGDRNGRVMRHRLHDEPVHRRPRIRHGAATTLRGSESGPAGGLTDRCTARQRLSCAWLRARSSLHERRHAPLASGRSSTAS